jgi:hypothetical protein
LLNKERIRKEMIRIKRIISDIIRELSLRLASLIRVLVVLWMGGLVLWVVVVLMVGLLEGSGAVVDVLSLWLVGLVGAVVVLLMGRIVLWAVVVWMVGFCGGLGVVVDFLPLLLVGWIRVMMVL